MKGMSCRTSSSSSSSCPSPPHLNSLSSLYRWLPKNILNTSPRLSSNLNDIIPVMEVQNRAALLLTSDKDRSFDSMDSQHSSASSGSKSYEELQDEILNLELEIMHLERHLLGLYRTALEDSIPTISTKPGTDLIYTPVPPSKTLSNQHCYKMEPHMKSVELVKQAPTNYWSSSDCQNHSHGYKPKFAKNRKNADYGHRSLAAHFGIIDDTHSPDKLSENIIRCISSIYCNLAYSSHNNGDLSASPTSSLASSSIFSSKNHNDNWSPKGKKDLASVHWLQGSDEGRGKIPGMLEITKISIDDKSFNYAAAMLQNFRSLVRDLEKVDPRKMRREQKLAFWINVHNALVMHAYLAYGICDRVRNTSILKAAYNVGGECVNAFDIQSSILGIRSYHAAPWLRTLLHSGSKLKTGITGHPYALEYAEPLVHFALCSGSYSDPVVRVYRSKSIFEDLKLAKEEFVRERVHVQKEAKISMPKMLHNFGKDMSLSAEEMVEMISRCSPSEGQRKVIRRWMRGRSGKKIEWIPHSSSFRYVIHGDLARSKPTHLPQ